MGWIFFETGQKVHICMLITKRMFLVLDKNVGPCLCIWNKCETKKILINFTLKKFVCVSESKYGPLLSLTSFYYFSFKRTEKLEILNRGRWEGERERVSKQDSVRQAELKEWHEGVVKNKPYLINFVYPNDDAIN